MHRICRDSLAKRQSCAMQTRVDRHDEGCDHQVHAMEGLVVLRLHNIRLKCKAYELRKPLSPLASYPMLRLRGLLKKPASASICHFFIHSHPKYRWSVASWSGVRWHGCPPHWLHHLNLHDWHLQCYLELQHRCTAGTMAPGHV